MQEKHIIVNYHYVEDPDPERGGIMPFSVYDFERQIEFLSKHYNFATVENVLKKAVARDTEKVCAITFDDGLKSQFINAVPILKTFSVPAMFFPITVTFKEKVPGVHKRHVLSSKVAPCDLIDLFNKYLRDNRPGEVDKYYIPKNRRIDPSRKLFMSVCAANFRIGFYAVPPDLEDAFLDYCFLYFKINEKEMANKLFMLPMEIKALKESDFEIGSHTHTHRPFAILCKNEIREEVKVANSVLFELLGAAPKILSYPYGSYNTDSIEVLKKEGFAGAVTIESHELTMESSPYAAPRFDANDIKKRQTI